MKLVEALAALPTGSSGSIQPHSVSALRAWDA